MNKIILSLLFLTMSFAIRSQNFNKKTISMHVNAGIEIYDTKYSYRVKINNLDTTINTTDKGANKNLSIGGEYALINKLTLGIRLKFNNYFTSTDSVTKVSATARSQDYMLLANYHLVDKEVFDLSAGIGVGGSHLYYNDNYKTPTKADGSIVNGTGPYFQFQVSPQFIIKERVGIGMSIYTPIVNYSKMTTNDATVNQYVVSKWKGSGYGFSFNINVILAKGEDK